MTQRQRFLSTTVGSQRIVLISHDSAHAFRVHFVVTRQPCAAATSPPRLSSGRSRGRARRNYCTFAALLPCRDLSARLSAVRGRSQSCIWRCHLGASRITPSLTVEVDDHGPLPALEAAPGPELPRSSSLSRPLPTLESAPRAELPRSSPLRKLARPAEAASESRVLLSLRGMTGRRVVATGGPVVGPRLLLARVGAAFF